MSRELQQMLQRSACKVQYRSQTQWPVCHHHVGFTGYPLPYLQQQTAICIKYNWYILGFTRVPLLERLRDAATGQNRKQQTNDKRSNLLRTSLGVRIQYRSSLMKKRKRRFTSLFLYEWYIPPVCLACSTRHYFGRVVNRRHRAR